jgi:hypothetical protein
MRRLVSVSMSRLGIARKHQVLYTLRLVSSPIPPYLLRAMVDLSSNVS